MNRTERLFELMQLLRRRRKAVQAAVLAERLGVSVRTVYRDIDTLRSRGVAIGGEAGVGFVLQQDNVLPPLMFDEPEIEALVFGMRWMAQQADSGLAQQGASALAKIQAVLPPDLAARLSEQALYPVNHAAVSAQEVQHLAQIRQALREGRTLRLRYTDAAGAVSERTVWPVVLGYFEQVRLLAAWCEWRGAFRHFRIDRIQEVQPGAAIPLPRQLLQSRWQREQGITLPDWQDDATDTN